MKKLSELDKEIEAFGCNKEAVTEFCIKAGLLEDDKKKYGFKVGEIWFMRYKSGGDKYVGKVTHTTSAMVTFSFYLIDGRGSGSIIPGYSRTCVQITESFDQIKKLWQKGADQ